MSKPQITYHNVIVTGGEADGKKVTKPLQRPLRTDGKRFAVSFAGKCYLAKVVGRNEVEIVDREVDANKFKPATVKQATETWKLMADEDDASERPAKGRRAKASADAEGVDAEVLKLAKALSKVDPKALKAILGAFNVAA